MNELNIVVNGAYILYITRNVTWLCDFREIIGLQMCLMDSTTVNSNLSWKQRGTGPLTSPIFLAVVIWLDRPYLRGGFCTIRYVKGMGGSPILLDSGCAVHFLTTNMFLRIFVLKQPPHSCQYGPNNQQ